MRFEAPLLVVKDLEQSKKFYNDVLGLEVIMNFGANVTLTGGFALQTLDTWTKFINKPQNEIIFGANASELYFEEEDFDGFIQKLHSIRNIDYVHPVVEYSWGQRVVRFYDPDRHIIEVGEHIIMVVKRFIKSGLSVEETAIRMDVPIDYVLSTISSL